MQFYITSGVYKAADASHRYKSCIKKSNTFIRYVRLLQIHIRVCPVGEGGCCLKASLSGLQLLRFHTGQGQSYHVQSGCSALFSTTSFTFAIGNTEYTHLHNVRPRHLLCPGVSSMGHLSATIVSVLLACRMTKLRRS